MICVPSKGSVSQLFPFPGSKADRKYDRALYPSISDNAICEPFLGSAARSLMYCDRLRVYAGEINLAQREIAVALYNPEAYVHAYREAMARFWNGFETFRSRIFEYVGRERSQSALSAELPDLCAGLTQNWRAIAADVFQWMNDGNPKLAGYYAFCLRACFGNVMRLNPRRSHFNIKWHVDKLNQACLYNPQQWIDKLSAMRWDPILMPDWESAIAAVENPEKCWLLLDPPYTFDYKTEKMTPCYVHHKITTQDGNDETFRLAIDSLKAGLERGFSSIAICNYFVPRLHAAIAKLVADADYSYSMFHMGRCDALGNSNGRLKHGNRMDGRARPTEIIYRIERMRRASSIATSQKVEQLSLV